MAAGSIGSMARAAVPGEQLRTGSPVLLGDMRVFDRALEASALLDRGAEVVAVAAGHHREQLAPAEIGKIALELAVEELQSPVDSTRRCARQYGTAERHQ